MWKESEWRKEKENSMASAQGPPKDLYHCKWNSAEMVTYISDMDSEYYG